MGYEVDFFPAAAGQVAMAVRWGVQDNYKVLVYDGGTTGSGEQLVEHVAGRFGTSRVDYAVSPRPARSAAGGLAVVLKKLQVGELWMHRLRRRSAQHEAPAERVRGLERLALERGVPVHEPFEGAVIGPFTVLSPQRDWYADALRPAFGAPQRAVHRLSNLVRLGAAWVAARCGFEWLPRRSLVRAEDEASAVLYAEFEGRGVLLTGNAGSRALRRACSFAEELGISMPSSLRLLQVPDHGSPDNLSSDVLDRVLGQRRSPGTRDPDRYVKSAFVSSGRDGPALGYGITAAALRRRGVMPFLTQGAHLHHAHDMPARGWSRAKIR